MAPPATAPAMSARRLVRRLNPMETPPRPSGRHRRRMSGRLLARISLHLSSTSLPPADPGRHRPIGMKSWALGDAGPAMSASRSAVMARAFVRRAGGAPAGAQVVARGGPTGRSGGCGERPMALGAVRWRMLRRRLAVGWLLFRALLLSRRAIAAPPCAPGALPAA